MSFSVLGPSAQLTAKNVLPFTLIKGVYLIQICNMYLTSWVLGPEYPLEVQEVLSHLGTDQPTSQVCPENIYK